MKKILIITSCTQCAYFNINMFGYKCTKKDKEIPVFKTPNIHLNIPDWCPLETVK